ncbi:DUF4132 domain-containing protein [Corynebacterium sp.]|uniref:DUF4132 domain-containing protein n=1 Tax=Corynebacterium sp. TaxID=1720 RepID=UPI0026DA8C6E|nr:DUF4132 domain-containing protein [Corynebacterium sp.]MDO5076633.1 DUF4132 domain-containing protein [Corynebacterium sp.]
MADTKTASPTVADDGWVDAGSYSFKLQDGVIVARNDKGRVLKTVPAKAKKLPQFEQIDGLRVFLAQHEEHCLYTVRRWFLHGLPVPVSVLCAVWPDPSWRKFLRDVVVSDGQITGFLRAADDAGVQIVDLDGESNTIAYSEAATVMLQHPAVMAELEEWREFAVELGISQGLDQLFRDVYRKPADSDGQKRAMAAYSDGNYGRAAHLFGRARGGGFVVTMNQVSIDVHEDGRTVSAELGIDAYDMGEEAIIGSLSFTERGVLLPADRVGPIAWSEGVRMCEFVYAGRTITTDGGQ